MDHQCGSKCGGVDRTAGGAGTDLGFGLWEQCGGVMIPGVLIDGGQHPHDFAEHSSVAPECAGFPDRFLDGGAAADRVYAGEDRFAGFERWSIAIGDRFDLNRRIDALEKFDSGIDFQAAEIIVKVDLRGDVPGFHEVMIYQLDLPDTEGGQLNRDLPADRADADNRDDQAFQLFVRNEVLLAFEAVCCVHHCSFGGQVIDVAGFPSSARSRAVGTGEKTLNIRRLRSPESSLQLRRF